ncbi:YeeE/YedE thiosulfate transporter family protein [uncultured Tateyamaria sp.]|uniref:YeeE/YedE thiosulfate transporter family protein n=1 Tax=uncultured Tateyamaria sp. TaxID=455651 RepID=UPI002637CE1B|nr:YeeE/YedE thiosulfate transporter family protein [uncultured Tateyamaria sp.]
MTNALTILAAFILGFALSRASTCTVAATMRLVHQRKFDWLLGIAVAVSWSALALFLIRLVFSDSMAAPQAFAINATLVAAAIIMGVGAWMNSGCFIGSVGRVSSGNLSFVATFLGLAASQMLSDVVHQSNFASMEPVARLSTQSGAPFWGFVATFAALLGWSVWRITRRRQQAIIALATMGAAAAIVYSLQPSWSYEALIGRLVHGENVLNDLVVVLTVAALFAGATISAALNQKFQLTHMGVIGTISCFLGGLLMGLGAQLMPGGNDTLILWVIPSFAFHALVAYLLMIATVALLLMIKPPPAA